MPSRVIADPHLVDTNPLFALGNMMELPDGRRYRYSLAGGVALVAGTLQQTAPEVANHETLAVAAAAAIGATSVSVTLGATAATANQYAGGYLVVSRTPGNGITYKIKGHLAIGSSGTGTINLTEPLIVALTTSSKVCLVLNPWAGTVIYPTTCTSSAAGVAPVAVAAGSYYWAQTHGIASVLADGALTVGSFVSPSNGTAGAVENGVIAQGIVGIATQTGVTTDYAPVFLTID